jgi:hypothetical protein
MGINGLINHLPTYFFLSLSYPQFPLISENLITSIRAIDETTQS